MRIERLELYGYKRLLLNNIRHFTYTPTQTYQLILGTNGSGKSSLLYELSPLPAAAADYIKDGFKIIHLSHRGQQYVLTSTLKTGKHSFRCNEEEFNPGGTGEVQKMLVQQHFGITRDIHELMTGELRFTQMSPAERRKWITAISKVDYAYAMATFKRIASRTRDQQGALKHVNQRLTQETHNLQALSDLEGLDERAAKLQEELNVLMLERIPNLPSFTNQQQRIHQLCDQIVADSREFFKSLAYLPNGKHYQSNDDVNLDLQRLDSNLNATQTMLDRMGNEYSEMETVVNAVQMDAGEDLDDLPHLIEQQQLENERWRATPTVFTNLLGPEEIQRDWRAIADEVIVTFRSLPDNRDRRYSNESMQHARDEVQRQQNFIDGTMAKISNLQTRMAAMREAQETQCPSCKYIWRPGYSDEEMQQIQEQVTYLGTEVDRVRVLRKEREAFLEEADGYAALYRRFRGFVQGYPRLQPLWDYILTNQLLLNDPKSNVALFEVWRVDLDANVQWQIGLKRLQHYLDVQERQNSLGDQGHFNRRMLRLHEEIAQATQQLFEQRLERGMVDKYYRKLVRAQELGQRMEAAYTEIERIRAGLLDAIRNEVIDETVRSHQLEMGGILRKLSEKEGQAGIVRDLETSRADVEVDVEAMRLLTAALSPNEGLIAEQLSGDIGCLVAQLNSIIASIWTYGMKVISCGLDTGELDYKFPVEFETHDNRPVDVSKTSKGQRQVIDLAFQLTAMLYMDFTDYPLFLDEPGEGFDEQHRIGLMSFVKQLMDANQHSQLFMISHYASGHGSFVGAETLVLDASNISVAGDYNKHAVLA
ncbi:hypothetical protein LUCX_313 [Xanthomonas phage vB_XciM_LucasX]|nr:hypothetical protein LUCX_313 [Xanthomonas phage vB_XciM_LucasX]